MCLESSIEVHSSNFMMENELLSQNKGNIIRGSILLELSASDDLDAFRREVEEKGRHINELAHWYGRTIGSRKMCFEERTPLLIAAMFASAKIVKYIIETGKVDVNKAYGSDKVTALHCAVAGGSSYSTEIIKLLLEASADASCVDINGNKPDDLIATSTKALPNPRRKAMEMFLRGDYSSGEVAQRNEQFEDQHKTTERKEYPLDVSLPDINTGIYGTDEFRMYSFKVKPCLRAYTHDWTECPFAHPGENAKRRDPRKYPYSCVPCPEFRKGACQKGDACEYAHGVFESWLHPAQYKTRICKDEIRCARKVCFFAHKSEELRPVYSSTGSALPSPCSHSVSSPEMATSTPPMSPLGSVPSPMRQISAFTTPPTLQLPSSRLKTFSSARDLDFELELLGLENRANQQQQYQHLGDEIFRLASPSYRSNDYRRKGELKLTNYCDVFGNLDSPMLSQLQRSKLSSSRVRKPSPFGLDSSVATAVMNSRSSAFAKRSQSFIDRAAPSDHSGLIAPSNLSPWGSPDGKLDWSVQGDDLNKLTKSASFGFRAQATGSMSSALDEPDISWVNSLVKDVPVEKPSRFVPGREFLPSWTDHQYIEQEQMVA